MYFFRILIKSTTKISNFETTLFFKYIFSPLISISILIEQIILHYIKYIVWLIMNEVLLRRVFISLNYQVYSNPENSKVIFIVY